MNDETQPAPGIASGGPAARRPAGELRVAIFSDALPERNGAGAYYEDIAPQLAGHLAELRLFRPAHKKRLWRLALPLPGDPTQKLILPDLWRIGRSFGELRPDLVISVTPGPFGLLGMRLARKTGCGFISAFHTHFEGLTELYGDTWFYRLAKTWLRGTNRRLFRASAAVLVNNGGLGETVESLGACRVEVMGTPLAPTFLDSPPPAHAGGLGRVLFAGRLAPEKNLPALEEAIRARPELEFVLAGDGPLRPELERLAERCGNLRLTGWLGRQALREEMDAADLLVLPSHQETFGTVALEAMARGRPALVAESAGIHHWPELAEALFRFENGQTLSNALRALEALPAEEWRQRSEAARKAAVRLNDDTIDQWIGFIETYARKP